MICWRISHSVEAKTQHTLQRVRTVFRRNLSSSKWCLTIMRLSVSKGTRNSGRVAPAQDTAKKFPLEYSGPSICEEHVTHHLILLSIAIVVCQMSYISLAKELHLTQKTRLSHNSVACLLVTFMWRELVEYGTTRWITKKKWMKRKLKQFNRELWKLPSFRHTGGTVKMSPNPIILSKTWHLYLYLLNTIMLSL